MQDAQAQFDETVLELIEQSPTGAVPGTPTYQDALKRLYAAHQVYASADHKGGHVTARSLSKQPSFYAQNLAAVMSGGAPLGALEPNRSIFDRYVQSLPAPLRAAAEGARLRAAGRVAHHRLKAGAGEIHDPVHTLVLVPGTGPHPGLPGNYLFGAALQLGVDADARWAIQLHDSDDGVAGCEVDTMTGVLEKITELVECAPFMMTELEALGFELK